MPETFEAWVKAVFEGEEPDPAKDHAISVERMARLLEGSKALLEPYPDYKKAEGLEHVFFGDDACALKDEAVDWELRRRCVAGFETLYADVFAPRCENVFSSKAKAFVENKKLLPLHRTAVMFFDPLPIHGSPKDAKLDAEMLRMLGRLLSNENVVCQEAALHGLGHWEGSYPEEVASIVERFLDLHGVRHELDGDFYWTPKKGFDGDLLKYACDARGGVVQ